MLSAAVVTPSLSAPGLLFFPLAFFFLSRATSMYLSFSLSFLSPGEEKLFAFPFSHAREKHRAKADAVDDSAVLLSRQVIPLTIYVQ